MPHFVGCRCRCRRRRRSSKKRFGKEKNMSLCPSRCGANDVTNGGGGVTSSSVNALDGAHFTSATFIKAGGGGGGETVCRRRHPQDSTAVKLHRVDGHWPRNLFATDANAAAAAIGVVVVVVAVNGGATGMERGRLCRGAAAPEKTPSGRLAWRLDTSTRVASNVSCQLRQSKGVPVP